MNIKLAIADRDGEYIDRLLNVLAEYKDLNLSVYTDREGFEKALEGKYFDIVLFSPSVCSGQISLKKSTMGIVLREDSVEVPEECREFPQIEKYQRISRIYKKILEFYAEVCGDTGTETGRGQAVTIGFFSPAGGTGKTTLALAAATKLSMQGYKTFYMNFEDIPSEDCYLPQTGEKGMSEMLNCLGTEVNFKVKMQGLLQTKTENLYYLNHFNTPNDIYEMEAEEAGELVASIVKTGLFDFIIIDMGISIDSKNLKIFGEADKLVIVEKPDTMTAKKMERFLMQTHIIKEYGSKMVRVLNCNIGRGSSIGSEIPLLGTVSMVQNPDAAHLITMLAGSTAGDFILSLTGTRQEI